MDGLLRAIPQGWGDLASIVGLAVAMLGFGFTLRGVFRARTAAQAAAQEASKARQTLTQYHAIGDLSGVVVAIEDIKRHHRNQAWQIVPDRYSTLRSRLVEVRASCASWMDVDDNATIQSAIQHLRGMEQTVDRILEDKAEPPSAARLNSILSEQMDKLNDVVAKLKIREDKEAA